MIFEDEKATYAPVESGVPQCSVLGSSLFPYYKMYINDIPVGLNSSRRHHCIHGYKIHYPCTTFATRSRQTISQLKYSLQKCLIILYKVEPMSINILRHEYCIQIILRN